MILNQKSVFVHNPLLRTYRRSNTHQPDSLQTALTWPQIELTIYHTRGEHAYHYNTTQLFIIFHIIIYMSSHCKDMIHVNIAGQLQIWQSRITKKCSERKNSTTRNTSNYSYCVCLLVYLFLNPFTLQGFPSFGYEQTRTGWLFFQKRSVRTKLNIYFFFIVTIFFVHLSCVVAKPKYLKYRCWHKRLIRKLNVK